MDGNPSCSPSSQLVAQPTIAVLSLDGGGLKGLLTLQMLKELERRTGKRIRELFQVIAGTSTGGILALAIQEGVPLEFIERLYLLLGQGSGEGSGEVEGEGEGEGEGEVPGCPTPTVPRPLLLPCPYPRARRLREGRVEPYGQPAVHRRNGQGEATRAHAAGLLRSCAPPAAGRRALAADTARSRCRDPQRQDTFHVAG